MITKDPGDTLDYSYDVVKHLDAGDTISAVSAVGTNGLTIVAAGFTGTVVTAKVSGGDLGRTAYVVFTIDTTGGDRLVRRLALAILAK